MSINTLLDSPATSILYDNHLSDDMAERIEAYNLTTTITFTDWMAEIFARRTER